jgi:hypothetical protein
MRQWTLPLVLGAVGLVALAAGFGASGAIATSMHPAAAGVQGGSAGCGRLMSDPAASKAMQSLRAEHVQDMQAWQARYAADPQSDEAQAALRTMRKEHVREMRAAFKELGIKAPAGACNTGMMNGMNGTHMMDGMDGAGMMRAGHGGMMGAPADGGAGTF